MASWFSRGVTGGVWQSKLVHVQYEGTEVRARYEFHSDLSHIVVNDDNHNNNNNNNNNSNNNNNPSFYSIPFDSPFRSKITKVSAFVTDLPVKKWLPKEADKMMKHHYVELEAKSGDCITIEKLQDCILLQTCRRFNPKVKPVVRHQRNGQKRAKYETLERIITELQPKDVTVFDILLWLDEKSKLIASESNFIVNF